MSKGRLHRLMQSPWTLRLAVLAVAGLMAARCVWTVFAAGEPCLNNDEPRQIMTAVFWYDFFRILPLSDPVGFTYAYYGHYPAIAPLHWPPLTHWLGGLTFLLTGPGVQAARLLVVLMAMGFLAVTYAWMKFWAGETASLFGVLLLAGCPLFLTFAPVFMLEVPCLFWISLAVLAFSLYVRKGRAGTIWLTAGLTLAALLTKQHALTLLPLLLAGAIVGFGRKQWRNAHVWLAGAAAAGLAGAYYVLALGRITTSWQDAAVVSHNSQRCLLEFLNSIGPLAAGSGIASLVALPILWRRSKPGWVGLVWAAGVMVFFLAMGSKEIRYLVYLLPVTAAGGGVVLGKVFGRLKPAGGLILLGGLLAVSGYQIVQTPMAGLDGYQRAARRAGELACGPAVVFGGKFDGPFILYRRLADERLSTITVRTGKLLGGGVVVPTRRYREYVSSEQDILDKLATAGASLIVVEQDVELDRPAYQLFWNLLGQGPFELVDETPVRYPNGQHKVIRFYRYLGPVKAAADITLPMPSLSVGHIRVSLDRALLDWNRRGQPPATRP